MPYTQITAARKGEITDAMRTVAAREGYAPDLIRDRVAEGSIAIPANRLHTTLAPAGVGQGLSTKINVNLGISRDCQDFAAEQHKAQKAVEWGGDAIMDLSSYGRRTGDFRRWIVQNLPVMLGTVPIYDAIGFLGKDLRDITADDFLRVVEAHARDGVDFMTIHAGINRGTAERFRRNPRLTHIVSRGGSLLFAWMELTGQENPFYEHYDALLDILAEYDVTISLGDACRPGCLHDASDASQLEELITLGELTRRAWRKDVQVMVEGPGHMPLDQIAANMKLQKTLCHNAPFYVLGPLVTDIAPGYDHITSAIGGAIAAASGADFLCYVTPAEHLRLPDEADMKEGIMASRIAAHAADIAKGIPGARCIDDRMSAARQALDWEGQFALCIDPEKARAYRESSRPTLEDSCTMCGNLCAMRNMNRILKGEEVSLLDTEEQEEEATP